MFSRRSLGDSGRQPWSVPYSKAARLSKVGLVTLSRRWRNWAGAGRKRERKNSKMRLRLIINAIIDWKVHTAEMTEEQTNAFMMQQGFQEEGEAAANGNVAVSHQTSSQPILSE